jgi:hypothetical protein
MGAQSPVTAAHIERLFSMRYAIRSIGCGLFRVERNALTFSAMRFIVTDNVCYSSDLRITLTIMRTRVPHIDNLSNVRALILQGLSIGIDIATYISASQEDIWEAKSQQR